jgi:hypothetical protein
MNRIITRTIGPELGGAKQKRKRLTKHHRMKGQIRFVFLGKGSH